MTYETLLIERRHDVAYVTLNRPAALDALSTTLRQELKQFFTAVQADHDVRVIVVTGAGRAFCPGG
jgi:enoyl-CoA hydratase/carnithine racemase